MLILTATEQKEFESIKMDASGGLDQGQVQLALRGLFRDARAVYVPSIEALSETLPLSTLDPEVKYAAFSLDVSGDELTAKHQIGVWVSLKSGDCPVVTVMDSQALQGHRYAERINTQLQRLLGDSLIIEKATVMRQEDDWSCGVHAIANCLNQYQAATGQASRPSFDTESLLEEYFDHYLREKAVEDILGMDPAILPKMSYFDEQHKSAADMISFLETELKFILTGMEETTKQKLLINILRERQIRIDDSDFIHYFVKDVLGLEYGMEYFEMLTTGEIKWADRLAYNCGQRLLQQNDHVARVSEARAMEAYYQENQKKIRAFFPEWHVDADEKMLHDLASVNAFTFIKKHVGFIRETVPVAEWDAVFKAVVANKNISPDLYGQLSVFRVLKNSDNFIFRHFDFTVKNMEDFVRFLPVLSPAMRKHFLQKHKHLIRNNQHVRDMFLCIPVSERSAFADACSCIINDSARLLVVMGKVSEAEAFILAERHAGLIIEEWHLVNILAKIPDSQRLEFAERYAFVIHSGYVLSQVLHQLPELERCAFAYKHHSLVKNGGNVAEVIKELSPADALAFAHQHAHLMESKKYNFLSKVLECLSPLDRFLFAETYAKFIPNGYALSSILLQLKKNERLPFAQKHAYLITDDEQMDEVLECLSEPDRLLFGKTKTAPEASIYSDNSYSPVMWSLSPRRPLPPTPAEEASMEQKYNGPG